MSVAEVEKAQVSPTEARRMLARLLDASAQLYLRAGEWHVLFTALHDRKAYLALDYGSWDEFVTVELGMSRDQSYRLLDKARVLGALSEAGVQAPTSLISQRQAAVLAGDPTAAGEIAEAVDAGAPVAEAVREATNRRRPADPGPRPVARAARTVDAKSRETAPEPVVPQSASGVADPSGEAGIEAPGAVAPEQDHRPVCSFCGGVAGHEPSCQWEASRQRLSDPVAVVTLPNGAGTLTVPAGIDPESEPDHDESSPLRTEKVGPDAHTVKINLLDAIHIFDLDAVAILLTADEMDTVTRAYEQIRDAWAIAHKPRDQLSRAQREARAKAKKEPKAGRCVPSCPVGRRIGDTCGVCGEKVR
jgi:hypothetical protein